MTADVAQEPEAAQATGAELMPAEQVQVLATAAASAQQAANALEAATQHVIENPGVAGRDEFLALAAQARMLHMSGAAPAAVRQDPYIAFHVAMAGRDLGLSPSAALNLIDVIHTSNGPQLSLSPQLRLAQVRKQGLGNVRPKSRTATECVAGVYGPDGAELGEVTFTWEDARMAGLVGPQCQPGDHKGNCGQRGTTGGKCNQGYRTYPQRMLWWRSVGYACDDYFPEASIGLYSPEELGAPVDDEGRAVDPSTVELPPGYDDPAVAARQAQAERDVPADGHDLWELQELAAALPDEQQAKLRTRWKAEGSNVAGYPLRALPARLLRAGRAMVNAHWAEAVSAGADKQARLAQVREAWATVLCSVLVPTAAETPQDAPEPAAAPEPTADAPQAQGDEPGPPGDDVTAPVTADHQPLVEQEVQLPDEPGPPSVNWAPVLRTVAAQVRVLCTGLDDSVVEAVAQVVKDRHHTAINRQLADAGQDDAYPPESPIDLRRMAVCALELQRFADTGEVPTE